MQYVDYTELQFSKLSMLVINRALWLSSFLSQQISNSHNMLFYRGVYGSGVVSGIQKCDMINKAQKDHFVISKGVYDENYPHTPWSESVFHG